MVKTSDSTKVCLCFLLNHPFYLDRKYSFFDIGTNHSYEDEQLTKESCIMAAGKCYLPAVKKLLELSERYREKLNFGISISGISLELFSKYAPDLLTLLKKLYSTGNAEFTGGTYYRSYASLFSHDEFMQQVEKHRKTINDFFDCFPAALINTELISGCRKSQASDNIFLNSNEHIFIDIDASYSGFPLFLENTISYLMKKKEICFTTPEAASFKLQGFITIKPDGIFTGQEPDFISDANCFNSLQKSALNMIYRMENDIKKIPDSSLIHVWRKLQSSEIIRQMSFRGNNGGDDRKYSTFFPTPYDAYVVYTNVANDLREKIKKA